MMAPLTETTINTPAGLSAVRSESRSSTPSHPANPLSLTALTETRTLNGKPHTTQFNATNRTYTDTSPAGRVATTVVNAQHDPLSRQIAGLEPIHYAYDARGRLQEIRQGQGAEARITQYDYYADGPAKGYLHGITDPLARSQSYEYDAAGRIVRETLPDGRALHFEYDRNGNLTALIPPGRPAHLFDYTALDQTDTYLPPSITTEDPATRYVYNLDRQLDLITRPDGAQLDFVYDAGGRLHTLHTLHAPHGDTGYQYDTKGRLQTLTAPGGISLAYAYDGSLLTQTTWSGPVAGSVGLAYDNDFRVREIQLNGADPVAYAYDNDSLLTAAGALTLSRNAQNGFLTATGLGQVSDSLSYSGFGEVSGYTANINGSPAYAASYSRDKLGRITQKVETVQGMATSYDYAYDLAGRLVEVKQNGAIAASYGYDDNGNRVTLNGLPIAVYDDQDRLTVYNGTAYAYTANGELQSRTQGSQTTLYRYDVLGNLRQATLPDGTVVDYLIDGQNRRVGKKVNGALVQGLLYQDGLRPIAELDGSNQVVSRFVYADKGNVPSYLVKGGVTYRIVSNHLGSPRLVVNTADGTVAQRLEYDEWGRVLLNTNPGFQPFGFAGGIYDRDVGLVRFGARDYDPETGRWTAKDPIGFGGGDANLFAYTENDSVNWVDPEGEAKIGPLLNLGLKIGRWYALKRNMGEPPKSLKDPEIHHDFPQKFRDRFDENGIDIDTPAYCRWVEGSNHRKWSYDFNKQWDKFFQDNPNWTPTDAKNFLNQLRSSGAYN